MSEDGQACEHGHQKRGQRGPWPPLYFEIFSKKGCFLSFEWEKTNFTTFGHSLDKIWKNPLVAPPWKKSFRRL